MKIGLRVVIGLGLGLLGCAAPPASGPEPTPVPIRIEWVAHPSLPEKEAGPVVEEAAGALARFVEPVEAGTSGNNDDDGRPAAIGVIDRTAAPPGRWNLRLYTHQGDLIFEDTAGEGASALIEIGFNLARSRRVRSFAAHGSVFTPDVWHKQGADSIFHTPR